MSPDFVMILKLNSDAFLCEMFGSKGFTMSLLALRVTLALQKALKVRIAPNSQTLAQSH